ncbi:MAG: serine/threonine protein kinase [Nitrospirae bacterium]|nr:serine/threonine protein kinase [Nitrospirota bacterium]
MIFLDVQEIGYGGMGRIYSAFSPDLQRKVTLKTLHPYLTADPDFRSRLKKEAEILARLSHPNIVSYFGFEILTYDQHHEPCLVMEYAEGLSLQKKLHDSGPMTFQEILPIFLQLSDALCYLHQNQINHLDIKPENILMTQGGKILLADFGISTAIGQEGTTGPLQESFGSLTYTSPEQLKGERGDGRSDLFSFGMVLYAMILGKGYFDGRENKSIWGELVYDSEPLHLVFPKEIPVFFQNLIRKAVEKKKITRFQNISALLGYFREVELPIEFENQREMTSPRKVSDMTIIFASGLLLIPILLIGWSDWEESESVRKSKLIDVQGQVRNSFQPLAESTKLEEPVIQISEVIRETGIEKSESALPSRDQENVPLAGVLSDEELEKILVVFKSLVENRKLDALRKEFSPNQQLLSRLQNLFGSNPKLEVRFLQVKQEGRSVKVYYRVIPGSLPGEEGILLFDGDSWKLL